MIPLDFPFWKKILDQPEKYDAYENWIARLCVWGLYAVWIANQYFMFIILLNFLIAVISNSYDNVLER